MAMWQSSLWLGLVTALFVQAAITESRIGGRDEGEMRDFSKQTRRTHSKRNTKSRIVDFANRRRRRVHESSFRLECQRVCCLTFAEYCRKVCMRRINQPCEHVNKEPTRSCTGENSNDNVTSSSAEQTGVDIRVGRKTLTCTPRVSDVKTGIFKDAEANKPARTRRSDSASHTVGQPGLRANAPAEPPATARSANAPAELPAYARSVNAPAQPPAIARAANAPAQPPATARSANAPAQPPATARSAKAPAQPPATARSAKASRAANVPAHPAATTRSGKAPAQPLSTARSADEPEEAEEAEETSETSNAIDGLLSGSSVQEGTTSKVIELGGQLVDKQLEIIDEAQDKAAEFLDKGVQIDITPDKGWIRDDMFVPAGYHIDAKVTGTTTAPPEAAPTPFAYEGGVGNVLMSGCLEANYQPNDPCFQYKSASPVCGNMIDGAAFIGVGFDGRGLYSAESRKMSIVQRQCRNSQKYDGFSVPDTMNVHGIYDTIASMTTFESRSEYQSYLQTEAGVSGSYFGFYAGVKGAYGESQLSTRQTFMSVLDVDIYRYEIFMDEVRPQDLSIAFLKEFMSLPTSYYTPGSPIKYQNFIQRFGTHFIKSAGFGGRLEIRKTMDGEDVADKKSFSVQMEAEYKGLFASVGSYSNTEGEDSSRSQNKTTSTSLTVHGGSQEIASILSDMYSTTFKNEFKNWLRSIPHYPKAFRFLMGPITDLVNFRADDLFPDEPVDWGCDGLASTLEIEVKDGIEYYYYMNDAVNPPKKVYCPFNSRQSLEVAINRRRSSLKRAIEVYMEEGPISVSEIQVPACETGDEPSPEIDIFSDRVVPSWEQLTKKTIPFKVMFDMPEDLKGFVHGETLINWNMTRTVKYAADTWFTSDVNGNFHLYSGYNKRLTVNPLQRKMSIQGLILTYNEKDGTLTLNPRDFKASKKAYPTLRKNLKGHALAHVDWVSNAGISKRSQNTQDICNVKWSNSLRFNPSDQGGKCLHFTASTDGDIFVVFSTIPSQRKSWYFVHIDKEEVSINKGTAKKVLTRDISALATGNATLHQSYFVCIFETEESTLIEYGKSMGTSERGEILLTYLDTEKNLYVRFYAFANSQDSVRIMSAQLVPRNLTETVCKGDTIKDEVSSFCMQRSEKCHMLCDPLAGCITTGTDPLPTECKRCRFAAVVSGAQRTCESTCPESYVPVGVNKTCKQSFDLKVFDAAAGDAPDLSVGSLPEMKAMTMCYWIKIPIATDADDIPTAGWPIVFWPIRHCNHRCTTAQDFNFAFKSAYSPNNYRGNNPAASMEVQGYLQSVTLGDTRNFAFDAMTSNDGNWHQYCMAWSGLNGALSVYVDADRKTLSDTRPLRGTLNTGGFLVMSSTTQFTYYMTEVNVWDRVLSAQDISQNSHGCFSGSGNILGWQAFKETFATHSTNFIEFSTCPAEPTAAEADEVTAITREKIDQALLKYTRGFNKKITVGKNTTSPRV